MSEIGDLEYYHTASGLVRYQITVSHSELNQYQVIKGDDSYVVSQKARAKALQWDERWKKKAEGEKKVRERKRNALRAEERSELAGELTTDALETQERIDQILLHTLSINDAVDWNTFIDNSEFPQVEPSEPRYPHQPVQKHIPVMPKSGDFKYVPEIGILDRLFFGSRDKKERAAKELFEIDYSHWESQKAKSEQDHLHAFSNWQQTCNKMYEEYYRRWTSWSERRKQFHQDQANSNNSVEERKRAYFNNDTNAIVEYVDMVLGNSQYPDCFSPSWDLFYNHENKIVIVDYNLPSPDRLPDIKEVKYVKSRDELVERKYPKSHMSKLYDAALYKIALRTVHEVFESDVIDAISAITFNGFVKSTDLSTGHETTACVLSLQASKEEFLTINLAAVDPKVCFRKLKGVGSAKLHSITPVAPIMRIEREDKRFITAYDVAHTLNEGENLAAMDWEDFEHLIRELFEKEFRQAGAEVKVTKASRDGGVDAVIFDPDPIRGGKIVIQAKRYTNVVGVSAVRDLYGTLMNEGANKGVLVTTSNYGPDAYEFARGKPISLLDGGNLLHLLGKHGYKAKVDIKEAKLILAEEKASS